ncbi:hypothetical protein D9Q98_002629 [Chlorella vulgaris]|uniref:Dynein heavy chain n=1 Tax=Chlorella vulgaris TaxID=3077 RepID=A0A9D4YZJ0_CHLVU|nr:hypothetical protein D9Q98_002629 [Chlorella vulgaris]
MTLVLTNPEQQTHFFVARLRAYLDVNDAAWQKFATGEHRFPVEAFVARAEPRCLLFYWEGRNLRASNGLPQDFERKAMYFLKTVSKPLGDDISKYVICGDLNANMSQHLATLSSEIFMPIISHSRLRSPVPEMVAKDVAHGICKFAASVNVAAVSLHNGVNLPSPPGNVKLNNEFNNRLLSLVRDIGNALVEQARKLCNGSEVMQMEPQQAADKLRLVLKFGRLERVDIGGPAGKLLTDNARLIYSDFKRAADHFSKLDYDILDVYAPQFAQDFSYFHRVVHDVERRVASVILQGVSNCSKYDSIFKLLESFDELLNRGAINADFERKHSDLVIAFLDEIREVSKHLFKLSQDAPILLKSLAPHSGALAWASSIRERIKGPMQRLSGLSSFSLHFDAGFELVRLFNVLMAAIGDYEKAVMHDWSLMSARVTEQKLCQPVLRIDSCLGGYLEKNQLLIASIQVQNVLKQWQSDATVARKEGKLYTFEELGSSTAHNTSMRQASITDGSKDIAKHLASLSRALKLPKRSPAWRRFLSFTSDLVVDGLVNSILTFLEQLSCHTTVEDIVSKDVPLLEAQLELAPTTIVWLPSLDMEFPGQSVRSLMHNWIQSNVDVTRLVRRVDISEGSYAKEIEEDIREELEQLKSLWDSVGRVLYTFHAWSKLFWTTLNVEDLIDECRQLLDHVKGLPKAVRSYQLYCVLEDKVKAMCSTLPLVQDLYHPAIRDRHWTVLMRITVVESLENDTVTLQTLSSGKYVQGNPAFREAVRLWQQQLGTVDQVLNVWKDVQRKWQALEPIFVGSADIRVQLPEESKLFDTVNSDYLDLMRVAPEVTGVLEACRVEARQDSLEGMLHQLEECEKALQEYIETKRVAFPRLYFVSSSDVLDILSKGSVPQAIVRLAD